MTMWNRIQIAAGTTTTTLIHAPSEFLPRKRHRRRRFEIESDDDEDDSNSNSNSISNEQGHNIHIYTTEDIQSADDPSTSSNESNKGFWQESFDSHLNAAVVTNSRPYRYEIHRGKTVLSPTSTTESLIVSSSENLSGVDADVNFQTQPHSIPQPQRRFQSESGFQLNDSSELSIVSDPASKHTRHGSEAILSKSRSGVWSRLGKMYQYGQNRSDAQGISPPSSPELDPSRHRTVNYEVSPMEDDADMYQQEYFKGPRPAQFPTSQKRQSKIPASQPHVRQSSGQHPQSSIPMMRRERRKQQNATATSQRQPQSSTEDRGLTPEPSNHNAVSWQDPAGGRLTPTHGGSQFDEDPRFGVSTTIVSPNARQSQTPSPSLGHRIRQLGRGKPEPIESRPAWNGASGRQVIVEPMRDNKNTAPLRIPPKSNKRAERAKQPQPGSTGLYGTGHGSSAPAVVKKITPSRPVQTPERRSQAHSTTKPATHSASQSFQAAQSYPSPPAQPQFQSSTTPPIIDTPSIPALALPSQENAIKRKPPPPGKTQTSSHVAQPSTSSFIDSTQPDGLGLFSSSHTFAAASATPAGGEPQAQPSSRFSITTYATSNADSPRLNQEPIADLPPVSVMDRRRPIRGSESPKPSTDEPMVISLKSASVSHPLKNENQVISALKRNERSLSISSIDKALPLAPPEMVETKDRVILLNAKLESLGHRRNNINKSIKQMTELMPADRLLQSTEVLKKREAEKKKVQALKEELADIQQQEHELGMKLQRAYKRQERDANYESGTLWVRRFTG